MSEGALEYTLIKETKVNVQVSDIINELAQIVDHKLEDYYLYDNQPHLENDDDGDSVTVYISGSVIMKKAAQLIGSHYLLKPLRDWLKI